MGVYDLDEIKADIDIHERELKEREWIIDQCPIDIYVSSINPRWGYPHKLMSYYEARPSVAKSARMLIIDSGYRKIGKMDEILDASEKVDADWLIPPDLTPHFDGYETVSPRERVEELWWNISEYRSRNPDTKVMLPLHPPFQAHMEELKYHDPGYILGLEDDPWFDYPEEDSGEEYRWNARGDRPTMTMNFLDNLDGVAIGLKKMPVERRIEVLEKVDAYTAYDTHIHALSPGTEPEMLVYLRENPGIVDSIDISTAESAPANNKIPDTRWHQHQAGETNPGASWFPTGADVSTLRALESARITIQLNHMLSPLCNDSEFEAVYKASGIEKLTDDRQSYDQAQADD